MNNRTKKIAVLCEKFKAVLLISLIIVCIIQIGILWSSQAGSFPISLFSDSKTTSSVSIEDSKTKNKYLQPYRVIISTGFLKEHYIIKNGTKEYDELWSGAVNYITQALRTKPSQIKQYDEDAWGTLVATKPYTFEFKTKIPIEIVNWTLDLGKPAEDSLTGIYKLVICPNDPDNNYTDTLYIRDDKMVYVYDIKDLKGEPLNQKLFDEIFLKQDTESNSDYQMTIEMYKRYKIPKDLLGVFSGRSKEIYPGIVCKPVSGLTGQEYTYRDFAEISKDLFGNSGSDYDYDRDFNNTLIFRKSDGVYRLYKNSILEYKFIGNLANTEDTNVLDAYKTAISFLLKHRSQKSDLLTNVSVYLSSIVHERGMYVFNFDYSISLGDGKGEVPVLPKNYSIPNGGDVLSNAISIEVTSKNVTHFKWLALKFNIEKNPWPSDWNFGEMYQKVYQEKDISFNDFGIYYVINNIKTYDKLITPSFVLYTKDGIYDALINGK
jgi:hypothetical protein